MRTWLVLAAVICAQGCSSDASTSFEREFEAGADCPRLFELRNAAKRGASIELQDEMNNKLRSVQCFGRTSKRAADVPSNTGSFTVQEYRLYRDVISASPSVPEAEAIENAARKYGISPLLAPRAIKRVQDQLYNNNWLASPDAEIRHASDWSGETQ